MTFEDSVEKGLSRCLAAAGAMKDPVHDDYDGVSLLLGLSGGIDSSALLLALTAIGRKKTAQTQNAGGAQRLGLEISACHVNHNLRGADSAADEQFCRALCQELEVPLTVVDVHPDKDSEAELRSVRYAKLIRVAKQQAAPYIVTAHNLDDQVETMLFRLLRGSSLRGLVGMDGARPLDASMWPILLRPLLEIDRHQISSYLAERGVAGRIDGSNSDVRYARNFLRGQILGPLKERFPGLTINIERFRQTLQNENDYVTEQAEALLNRALTRSNELLLSVLDGEHPALTARVITSYIEDAGISPSFDRVQRIISLIEMVKNHSSADFSSRTSLGQNLELIVSKNSILLKPLYELTTSREELDGRLQRMAPVPVKMPRPGRSAAMTMVPWLDYAISISECSGPPDEAAPGRRFDRTALSVSVDLSKIAPQGEPLYIRPRRPGDHLQPVGMQHQVRLKQYLHANKSLFAGARALLPALNDVLALRLFPVLALGESQEVLWVPGFGLSEKIKCGQSPTHVLSFVPLGHEVEAAPGIDGGTC
jgi:tRNA(Ile)-lysidine synthase